MQQNPEKLDVEQPIEIKAEIRSDYLKFKRRLAEKNVIILNVNEIQLHFRGKFRNEWICSKLQQTAIPFEEIAPHLKSTLVRPRF